MLTALTGEEEASAYIPAQQRGKRSPLNTWVRRLERLRRTAGSLASRAAKVWLARRNQQIADATGTSRDTAHRNSRDVKSDIGNQTNSRGQQRPTPYQRREPAERENSGPDATGTSEETART